MRATMGTTRSTIGLCLMAVFVLLGAGSGQARAAAKKKPRPAPAAPTASAAELNKLKGQFKWGMTPDEVMAKTIEKLEGSYADRLRKSANDPTRQDRIRKELFAETDRLRKTAIVKFEGQKSGYDVSIVDQEFGHKTGESMLVAKEENASRYFFFAYDRLYKMFIAFDKEMLKDKSFEEFGQLMQARFGKARQVHVEEKSKKGVTKTLDHFAWGSKSGDALRLVDRSSFYDVYCLVIYDADVEGRQAEARKAHEVGERKDALVEAVTSGGSGTDRDPNDNVVDRITGRDTRRPGDQPAEGNVPVPTPARAPAPDEVNQPESGAEKPKPKRKRGSEETKGLEL